jgi:hypothetical protein
MKAFPSGPAWLKRISPTAIWGPEDQCLMFKSKAAALMAMECLKKAAKDGCKIERIK